MNGEIFEICFKNQPDSEDNHIRFCVGHKKPYIDITVDEIDATFTLTRENLDKLIDGLDEDKITESGTGFFNDDLLDWHFTKDEKSHHCIYLDIDREHQTIYIHKSFIEDIKTRLSVLKNYFYG